MTHRLRRWRELVYFSLRKRVQGRPVLSWLQGENKTWYINTRHSGLRAHKTQCRIHKESLIILIPLSPKSIQISSSWSNALYGSEAWTLRKSERKYLENFEMWCWRRMEKIKWPEKVTNEQVLERIGEKRTFINNILDLRRKANWIGHMKPIQLASLGHILRTTASLV